MAEYIEREALLKKQQMDADIFKGSTLRTDIARRDEALNAVANIVNAPAADVVPVRHGVWRIKHFIFSNIPIARCSLCGEGGAIDMNYCPGCGARMEGDEEDG